ncbi:hypothetical protein Tco_1042963, partial [Tanacetum coccineum]
MDIFKITRKQSKTGKHGHEEQKSTKEAKDSEAKPRKVNSQSTEVNPQKDKTSKVTTLVPHVFRIYTNGPWTLNGP